MRNRIVAIVLFAIALPLFHALAQQRTVDEVKKSIGDLSANQKTYQTALKKITPALTHPATKDKAETWWVAGRTYFALYDKYRQSKSVGNTVDAKDMGHSIVDGYECSTRALRLDTVWKKNKDGIVKVNKHGVKIFKVKYSKEILNRLYGYVIDYSMAGANLYRVKDYEYAFKAWDIYHQLVTSDTAKRKKRADPDSIIGMMRFYQGLAALKLKHDTVAHQQFVDARQWGYKKKVVFDNDLNVLVEMRDTAEMVKLANEAYSLYGKEDMRYMRILINDCVSKKNYHKAEMLLDRAIMRDSVNSEYFGLKGNIVEYQMGYTYARAYYARAVEIKPDFAAAQYDLGRCYYLEALDMMKANPKRSTQNFFQEVAPLLEKAATHLEKAHSMMPSDMSAINMLRNIYYKLGEGDKLDQIERSVK